MKTRPAHLGLALCLAGALLTGYSATPPAPAQLEAPVSVGVANLDRFCIQSQADISAAKVPAIAVLHTEYQSFVESKPAARPLRTEQYIWYATTPARSRK